MTRKEANRAVGYVRVSSEEQVENHSLAAQTHEIERFCEREGHHLLRIYADEGVSAHTEKIDARPQLSALLGAARRGDVDVVVVHTLDRWSRNVGVQRQALQVLGECNVGFASVAEDIDFTTPAGKLMLTMIGGVSEFFSDQLGVHVSKARGECARQGLSSGPVPFGYLARGADEPAEIVPPEAAAVSRAFEMKLAGKSNGEIANWLTDQGFRTRTGRLFTAHAVKDMLKCRFYAGEVKWREEYHCGRHEPIVSKSTFDLVRSRRTPRGPHRRTAGRSRGLLLGRLMCGRCGSRLHGDRGRNGRPMYREQHGRPCQTNRRAFMAEKLDSQVEDIFRAIQLPDSTLCQIADRATRNNAKGAVSLLESRRRLARAYGDGAFTEREYDARLAALDAEILAANEDAPVRHADVIDLLKDLPTLWSEATPEERRSLLEPLFAQAYVDVRSRRLTAVVPSAGLTAVLKVAVERTDDCTALVLRPDELAAQNVGTGGDAGESNSRSSKVQLRVVLQAFPPVGVSSRRSGGGARGRRDQPMNLR